MTLGIGAGGRSAYPQKGERKKHKDRTSVDLAPARAEMEDRWMGSEIRLWLVCTECGRVSRAATEGWRARLAGDDHEGLPEVVILCPECSERDRGATA